jgi:hypothetical protein
LKISLLKFLFLQVALLSSFFCIGQETSHDKGVEALLNSEFEKAEEWFEKALKEIEISEGKSSKRYAETMELLEMSYFLRITNEDEEAIKNRNKALTHDQIMQGIKHKPGSYIKYQRIVSHFFENYTVPDLDNGATIKFYKKPRGWYVAIWNYVDGAFVETSSKFLWRSDLGIFNQLDLPRNEEGQKKQTAYYLDRRDARLYDICPFYGYEGWEKAVIEAFGKKEIHNDTTLYGLGRAYSSYASNIIYNPLANGEENVHFDAVQGRNKLSELQMALYKKYRKLAIETFNELALRNPLYSTIVGDIGTKAANEYMVAYLDLWTYQSKSEALKQISAGLYSRFYEEIAKNYLAFCELNEIIFKGGDNVTYPLIYVQEVLNYRKDVTVVNVSLLNSFPYILALFEEEDPTDLTLSLEDYKHKGLNDYLPVDNQIPALSLEKLLQLLAEGYEALQKDLGTFKTNFIPASEATLLISEESLNHLKSTIPSLEDDILTEEMIFRITNNGLEKKDLIILDMIKSNNWERPIYFSGGSIYLMSFELKDIVMQEGSTYRLLPTRGETINTSMMYEFYTKKTSWDFDLDPDTITDDQIGFLQTYRAHSNVLIEQLLTEKKDSQALEILELIMTKIPNEVVPFGYFSIQQVDFLFRLNQPDLAKETSEAIKNNCLITLKNQIDTDAESDAIQKNMFILNTLIDTVKKHGYNEVAKEIQAELDNLFY